MCETDPAAVSDHPEPDGLDKIADDLDVIVRALRSLAVVAHAPGIGEILRVLAERVRRFDGTELPAPMRVAAPLMIRHGRVVRTKN